jgi:hypothetical protein
MDGHHMFFIYGTFIIVIIYRSYIISYRKINRGCPLSLLLFIFVVEGLKKEIREAERTGNISGMKIGKIVYVSHLLAIDDVLLFHDGSLRNDRIFKEIIDLYSKYPRMDINLQKESISNNKINEGRDISLSFIFPFKILDFNCGFKYVGFTIKPNDHGN